MIVSLKPPFKGGFSHDLSMVFPAFFSPIASDQDVMTLLVSHLTIHLSDKSTPHPIFQVMFNFSMTIDETYVIWLFQVYWRPFNIQNHALFESGASKQQPTIIITFKPLQITVSFSYDTQSVVLQRTTPPHEKQQRPSVRTATLGVLTLHQAFSSSSSVKWDATKRTGDKKKGL